MGTFLQSYAGSGQRAHAGHSGGGGHTFEITELPTGGGIRTVFVLKPETPGCMFVGSLVIGRVVCEMAVEFAKQLLPSAFLTVIASGQHPYILVAQL